MAFPDQDEEVAGVANLLVSARPQPTGAFWGESLRRLSRLRPGPRRLGLLVALYSLAGLLCLVIAALGALRIGPLAP